MGTCIYLQLNKCWKKLLIVPFHYYASTLVGHFIGNTFPEVHSLGLKSQTEALTEPFSPSSHSQHWWWGGSVWRWYEWLIHRGTAGVLTHLCHQLSWGYSTSQGWSLETDHWWRSKRTTNANCASTHGRQSNCSLSGRSSCNIISCNSDSDGKIFTHISNEAWL